MDPIQYKSWTIQDDPEAYCKGQLIAYPTEQGIQHDYDGDSDGWHYCGNSLFSSDVDSLKDEIDEKIMMEKPLWKVEVNLRKYNFEWIIDAIKFADMWGGNLLFTAD